MEKASVRSLTKTRYTTCTRTLRLNTIHSYIIFEYHSRCYLNRTPMLILMRNVAFIAKADRSINFRVTRHRALMVLPWLLIPMLAVVRWHVHSYRKMYEWQAFLNYNLTFTGLYGGDVHVYRGTWTCPEYPRLGSALHICLTLSGGMDVSVF